MLSYRFGNLTRCGWSLFSKREAAGGLDAGTPVSFIYFLRSVTEPLCGTAWMGGFFTGTVERKYPPAELVFWKATPTSGVLTPVNGCLKLPPSRPVVVVTVTFSNGADGAAVTTLIVFKPETLKSSAVAALRLPSARETVKLAAGGTAEATPAPKAVSGFGWLGFAAVGLTGVMNFDATRSTTTPFG